MENSKTQQLPLRDGDNTLNITPPRLSANNLLSSIPTIDEESSIIEKSPVSSSRRPHKASTDLKKNLVMGSGSSHPGAKSQSDTRSLVHHESSPVVKARAKMLTRAQTSLVDSSDKKIVRRFGTFAEEGKAMSKGPVVPPRMSFNSSEIKNLNMKVKIIDKENWADAKTCHICTRDFSKIVGIFEHHCRACGKAVCGDCSSKKIDDNRVCDVCFYKANNVRAEERRKDQLRCKNDSTECYKEQILKERDDLNNLTKKKLELEKEVNDVRHEQMKAVGTLQKERDKVISTLTKKKENNIKLKESLAVDKAFLKEKELEYEELRHKINALKTQVSQKQNTYEAKKKQLERLANHKRNYQESPSFIHLTSTLATENAKYIEVDN